MSERAGSAASKLNIAALMTALVGACIAFQLNASMLSPVLVTMGRELHADDAAIGLSQTAFFTSAALFSIFLPRLSDTLGRKRVLFWMLVTMTAGTVVAALAPNLAVLYLARIIQGVSGPVVPLCLLMLRAEISEPKLYGTMLGWSRRPMAGSPELTPWRAAFLPAPTVSEASSGYRHRRDVGDDLRLDLGARE